ncbi:hypothetical protein LTR12_017168 [Friedmanniomyces endolithicus]|nr:hypothetical protein LTR12_017168 [Friedmanniomyces endolithicus]
MDRLRRLWQTEQLYEPLSDDTADSNAQDHPTRSRGSKRGFSYINYTIFFLLGMSMLWAWNMFLAAGPYFQMRFRGDAWIFENFQASEISVSTATNLVAVLVLARLQANASYPGRILSSLVINTGVFMMLSLFTKAFLDITARGYFGILMVAMFSASLATGLCQNGVFAYVSGFGEPRYTQGIMTGQAVAGVLPCIAQIVSVLSVSSPENAPRHRDSPRDNTAPPSPAPPEVQPNSAFAYFLTATIISVTTLLAFLYFLARTGRQSGTLQNANNPEESSDEPETRKTVPLLVLLSKLRWQASAVFVTFAITMVSPVFTQRIVSVRPPSQQPAILQPACFIPLAYLFWNTGDLVGRLLTAIPSLSLVRRPKLLLFLAGSRIIFPGLYYLCNIRGRGAVVNSDFFYLVIVQLLFGITNGYLGSICMIGASEWVAPEEREAAGGFMGLCLVAGLTPRKPTLPHAGLKHYATYDSITLGVLVPVVVDDKHPHPRILIHDEDTTYRQQRLHAYVTIASLPKPGVGRGDGHPTLIELTSSDKTQKLLAELPTLMRYVEAKTPEPEKSCLLDEPHFDYGGGSVDTPEVWIGREAMGPAFGRSSVCCIAMVR